jgi:hypothetical protein
MAKSKKRTAVRKKIAKRGKAQEDNKARDSEKRKVQDASPKKASWVTM